MTLLPLVVLSLLLAGATTSATATSSATSTLSIRRGVQEGLVFPVDYQDDMYHCQNPNAVNTEISIGCDFESFQWNLDQLTPEAPPSMCNFELDLAALEDLYEPCALWMLEYGEDSDNGDGDNGDGDSNTTTTTTTQDPLGKCGWMEWNTIRPLLRLVISPFFDYFLFFWFRSCSGGQFYWRDYDS
jgi:hypothetical protein